MIARINAMCKHQNGKNPTEMTEILREFLPNAAVSPKTLHGGAACMFGNVRAG